jgi:hypothetical protein
MAPVESQTSSHQHHDPETATELPTETIILRQVWVGSAFLATGDLSAKALLGSIHQTHVRKKNISGFLYPPHCAHRQQLDYQNWHPQRQIAILLLPDWGYAQNV